MFKILGINRSLLFIVSAIIFKVTCTTIILTYFRHAPWAGHIYVDIWSWLNFLENSAKGLIPFVDFRREYPVGIGIVFWFFSFFSDGHNSQFFLNLHAGFFSFIDIINAFLLFKIIKAKNSKYAGIIAFAYLLSPISIILSPFRFESLVNTFLLLGILNYQKEKNYLAAIFLSIGTAIKIYPAIFFAVVLWKRLFETRKIKSLLPEILIFIAIILAINLPFIVIGFWKYGNIDNWLNTFMFHVKRPLFWDTPFGGISLWYGVQTLESYASLVSLILMAVIFILIPKMDVLIKTALIIFAVLFWNRVYSPQFHLWFWPLILIVFAEGKERSYYFIFLIVILDLITINIYPFLFTNSLVELKHFYNSAATYSGQFYTWFFTFELLLRPIILMELILYSISIYLRINKFARTHLVLNIIRIGLLIVALCLFSAFGYDTYNKANENQKRLSLIMR